MSIAPRQTFLMKSGTLHAPDRRHLWIVCLDVDDKGKTLIVSVASYTNKFCDDACILEEGEHSFIKHKSYILYRRAQKIEVADLEAEIASGDILPRDTMSDEVFLKVQDGVMNSRQTPRKIKHYFAKRMQGK